MPQASLRTDSCSCSVIAGFTGVDVPTGAPPGTAAIGAPPGTAATGAPPGTAATSLLPSNGSVLLAPSGCELIKSISIWPASADVAPPTVVASAAVAATACSANDLSPELLDRKTRPVRRAGLD